MSEPAPAVAVASIGLAAIFAGHSTRNDVGEPGAITLSPKSPPSLNFIGTASGLYFAYGRRGCDQLVEARKVVLRDRDSMVSRIEVLEFTGSLRNKAPGALVGPDTSVQPGPRRIDIVKIPPHREFGLRKRLTVPAEARLDGSRSFPLPGLHIQALDLIPEPAHL